MAKKPNRPLFILSCERSGSTLLRFILDTHPAICCPGHLYLGPLCQSLYDSAYYSIAQLQKDAPESAKELVAIGEVRRVVLDMLGRYSHEKGKSRWCEKTTLNINHLPILSKVFPEGQFICLYRNSLDVIHSSITTSAWGFMDELAPYVQKNPDNFVAAMAESWLEKNQKLFEFEQCHQDQCFRLTYESLVTETNGTLAQLFSFLGLEWDRQLLDNVFTTHHEKGHGDTRILFTETISQASVGKGGRIPLSHLRDDLCQKINVLHNGIGYQPIQMLHAAMQSAADTPLQANENVCVEDLDLRDFFEEKMTEIVKSKHDEFRFRHGICKIVIPGMNDESWLLDTTGKDVTFRKGATNHADCSISISYQTFYDIFKGDINPVDAYDQREIHVDGNMETALRYGKLLFNG